LHDRQNLEYVVFPATNNDSELLQPFGLRVFWLLCNLA